MFVRCKIILEQLEWQGILGLKVTTGASVRLVRLRVEKLQAKAVGKKEAFFSARKLSANVPPRLVHEFDVSERP